MIQMRDTKIQNRDRYLYKYMCVYKHTDLCIHIYTHRKHKYISYVYFLRGPKSKKWPIAMNTFSTDFDF